VLVYLVRRRRDLPFPWMFWLFGAFILGCGTTHLMEVVTTYTPVYRLAGLLKLLTAAVSVVTAVALLPLLPRALLLPSPRQMAEEVEQRKQAQEVAERQAALLDLAHDGIFVRDLESRVTYWNRGAEAMYGWTKHQALGQTTHHLLGTEFPRPFAEVEKEVLREGHWEGELVHTRRDGSRVVVASRWALQRDDRGRPLAILEINRDITQRKRAEEGLRQAQAELERRVQERTAELSLAKSHLEAVFQSVEEGVVVFEPHGKVVLCNDALARMVGYASGQDMMRDIDYFARAFELTGPRGEVIPVDQWPVRRVLRGETFSDWECHGRRRDTGREWDFRFSGRSVTDPAGRVLLAIVVTRDVTERKRAEEALKASEARFRGTFEQAAVGIAHVGLDGRWLRVNQRLCDIVGYGHDELLRLTFQDITHPDDLEADLALYRRLQAGEIPTYAMEKRYFHKGGQVVWINLTVALQRDGAGTPEYAISVVEDISRRKQAEEALREADRRKDEFLAMLAHELRNPLAPLRTGLQILKMSPGDGPAAEQTRAMMERQVMHMSRLVDDLLDVSRVTKGKLTLRPERLDLGRLVRTVAQDHRDAFARSGLSLNVDVPELPVWVLGDAARLTQTADNLLQNAAKFTDRGGTVSVRVEADRQRAEATLTVRDTGVGIDPEMLPRLFDVFAQADRSLARSKGGLGLGLALVKGLAELHGGRVRAASAGPGRGAEFTVTLPLEPEPAALAQRPAPPARARGRLRVLIVEDNRDTADSLRLMLEVYGHEVRVAYTGPDGVRAAAEWRPDVVVCDIGLPGLDGYGVVSALRRNPATAAARVIAVTGYGSEEDQSRSRAVGFDEHLTKPVDPETLISALAPATS
jgi:PAS domain S-box-containing protein